MHERGLSKMKYSLKKKIGYSVLVVAMVVGFTLMAVFGYDKNGSGSVWKNRVSEFIWPAV